MRVSVPPSPHRAAPPLLGRYALLSTDHRPLFEMARDACGVIAASGWSLFMERSGTERVLFYFNLSPPRGPARPAGLRGLGARARARHPAELYNPAARGPRMGVASAGNPRREALPPPGG